MDRYQIELATERDIEAIAALFTESFGGSIIFYCGKLPKPLAMQDVFRLVYQSEPAAAFVARQAGKTVGYCFAPVRLSNLWCQAVTGGHVFVWLWRWLAGKYGIGIYTLKMLSLNKLSFWRSAVVPGQAASARILSVAVAESHRGQGVGWQLMLMAIDYFTGHKVEVVRLEVRPDNEPAKKMYERLGFKTVGTTSDPQGEWLIMIKEMGRYRDV